MATKTKKTGRTSKITKSATAKPKKTKETTTPKPAKTTKVKTKTAPKTKVTKMKKPAATKPKKKVILTKATKVKAAIADEVILPKTERISTTGPVGIKPYKPTKNEEYMNQNQLAHFRSILLAWKEQIMEEMGRTVAHMQKDAANFPDPIDRASQEEEFSLELRTRDRERKLLKKIDEALDSIQSGDYGYCEECGAEIGVRRLEARPTATQCVECKTVSEIREKQTGG